MVITTRKLLRTEIEQVWSIDRREVIENIYYFENGELVLKPEYYDMQGWPSGDVEKSSQALLDCFDRGGWFLGAFDDGKLVGAAILDNKFIGRDGNQLQLKFLHVSRNYRKHGLGKQLFHLAADRAREMGAKQMYISATPSENTVNFYMRLGAVVTKEPDAELFALEPEDIHFECKV